MQTYEIIVSRTNGKLHFPNKIQIHMITIGTYTNGIKATGNRRKHKKRTIIISSDKIILTTRFNLFIILPPGLILQYILGFHFVDLQD